MALCQQTDQPATAQHWLQTLATAGIEGLVIKDAGGLYPTSPGRRVWHKLKARATVELVCTAVVGDPRRPTLLMLSSPTAGGDSRPVGATARLTRAAATAVGRLLTPTGGTETRYGGGPPPGRRRLHAWTSPWSSR